MIDSIRKKLPDSDVSSKRGGVIEYNCDFTDEERLSLDNVLLTRRSVRNYSSKIVPFDIITDAIKVAWSGRQFVTDSLGVWPLCNHQR